MMKLNMKLAMLKIPILRAIAVPGLVLLLLLSVNNVFAQAAAKTLNGVVKDKGGELLIGVNVLVKGTITGTSTNAMGKFSIQASESDFLVFSYTGFETKEIAVGTKTYFDVMLGENSTLLDEVVIIGYGSQKKSDLTGSVGTVSGEDIAKFSTANATNAIQGRMAGVRVEANGGAPGADALVTIRGSSTLSDSGPLYVIDGMLTGNMNSLNPADIETVTVLKDASAAAIYGSRAANGVIIVTTKKGKAGAVSVDVDLSYGTQKVINTIDWANAREYADIVNAARDNDGNDRFPANDTDFNPNDNSDIQAASLRTAPMYNAGLRISGGGENATFSFSANHLTQEGIVRESDFSRSNLRLNATFRKGRFKLEQTIGLSRTINNPNEYFNRERDLIPTVPIYDADGSFTGQNIPAGNTSSLGGWYGPGNIDNSLGRATIEDRTNTTNSLLGTIGGSFEIFEGLFYKLNLGVEYTNTNKYRFTPTFFFNGSPVGNKEFNELDERNNTLLSPLVEHTLNYKKVLKAHNFDLLAGYTAQKTNDRQLGVVARRTPSNDIRVASAAEDFAQAPSFDNTSSILSYFGRINYSFDDRFLLTATIRRDGSSLFRDGLRWGTFPSVAAGWNISNESFMEDATFFDDLKIRASYGEIGSNNVKVYSITPELNLNSQYPIGPNGERATGYSITKGVNPNITWETTKTTDIGIEMTVLQKRLFIAADYFIRNSEDVLVELGLPLYTGFGNRVPFNTASIKNKGFEFLADYNQAIGDFSFNVAANITFLNNEVTALGDATPIIEGGFTSNGLKATKTDIGQPVASFFGYVTDGIYQTDQEASEANDANSPQAGDIRFKDLNNDGMINEEDQQVLGNPAPDFEYGLNFSASYKDFDFVLFFNGVAGNQILNGTRYRGYFDTEGNYLADALNAWSPSNTGSNIPRNTLTDPGFNRRMSDFYLENGSYFRLRNIQIGYSLPTAVTEKLKMSRARIYISAQNLFTISEYNGYYPEVGRNNRGDVGRRIFNSGVDEGAYPTARTILFGIQGSF